MEVNIFPKPAVAGVLTQNYVEARLHTDSYDDVLRPTIQEQQLELQGGIGLPYYIALEPHSRRKLVEFARADQALRDANVFRAFLLQGVDEARRVAVNR